MKICIDARSPGYSGILTYASCLLRNLVALERGPELVVFRAPQDRPWGIEGVEERVLPARHFPSWLAWSNTALPRLLRREGFDVYHSLKHITAFRGNVPRVVTFHSARFLIHPEHYRWWDAAYWRVMSPLASWRYDAVIAVSEAEKRNYVERMGAPADKIHVVPLAAAERFRVIDDPVHLEAVRRRYGLPERFVLYVGRQLPVKNLDTLLRGFAHARRHHDLRHQLVLVGKESWHTPALRALAEELGIAPHVRFQGPIFEELPAVYNLADLFVLLSHYEAFPAVPLEAMACGTPVVTSDRGGLPEVVGDAGVFAPLDEPAALGERLAELLLSDRRRTELRERGLERSRAFSWVTTARRTVSLYEKLARSAR